MSKLDDLEKIQELKNKGILTQDEFEKEKQKILNIEKDIIPEETDDHTNKVSVIKNKKILYILIPIFVVILILVLVLIITQSTENKTTNEIENDNMIQYDNEITEENLNGDMIIEFNKKYKLKEVGVINSYIIFEYNHFEICYNGNDFITYSQGDYIQDKEKITFMVLKEGYTFENTLIGHKFEEEKIGTISNGGKTITISNGTIILPVVESAPL